MTEQISTFTKIIRGYGRLPIARQLGLLLGLSASIALGFAVVLWSQEPTFRPLYDNLGAEASGDILDALQATGIPFKIDKKTGSVLVPSDKIYDARFKLANKGMTQPLSMGFEMLDKDQKLGTSRFIEAARYRRALEGELARTIASLQGIKSARVHLGLPKDSVFVADKRRPTASILVDLAAGDELSQPQVAAIVKLVAASIPNLRAKDVAVVDQHGQLLTSGNIDQQMNKTKAHFNYTRQVEHEYAHRIESILIPLLGEHKVKARVAADIDYTYIEKTEESFLPDSHVLRSEQVLDEKNLTNAAAGVPGALANQPPAAAAVQNNQDPAAAPADNNQEVANGKTRRQATRNYELGKLFSHTKQPVGHIKYLSVAVVVDDHVKTDPKTGEITRTPLTAEEITKITDLVKNAIGYNQERGDKITVANIAFADPTAIEPLPAIPIWKQNWFKDVVKTTLAALLILIVVLVVLRPALRNLSSKGEKEENDAVAAAGMLPGAVAMMPNTAMDATQASAMMQAGMPNAMAGGQIGMNTSAHMAQQHWGNIKQMAADDPKRIAQVMNSWVGTE